MATKAIATMAAKNERAGSIPRHRQITVENA
jgi:hypothetical protein